MIHDEGRPFLEPDRRYWRRHANRHVRKARRLRLFGRWTAIVAANLAVAAVLIGSGATAVRHLTTTARLAVDSIEVSGTRRTTPESVRAALATFHGKNLADLDLAAVAAAAGNDPWVKSASVKRVLPGSLRVEVVERTPAALAIVRGVAHVVDDGGFVMGPAGPDLAFDLPVLTGLERADDAALREQLARGVTLLAELRAKRPALVGVLSELDLSTPDRVTARTAPGEPTLLLDPDHVDRNIDAYLSLRPLIARNVGPAETVDLRWSRRIGVLPARNPSRTENE